MRMLVIAHNEIIKARMRAAFWVGFGAFSALMAVVYGSMHFQSARRVNPAAFALPGAWREIVGGPGVMSAFFAAMVLILLVASEFTWRTARQNVIDGLSKEEFFAGKLLLLPALGVLFFAVVVLIGGGFALSGTHADGAPLVRTVDAEVLGGAFVGLFGWGAFAFLLAVTIRNSGPAIGAFFLYFLVEQIVGQLVARTGQTAATIASYLPMAVFKALWQPPTYLAIARPGQSHPPAPSVLAATAGGYVGVFLIVAFVIYRRRDL